MLGRYLPLRELQAALPLQELEKLGPLVRQLDPAHGPVDPLTNKEFLGRLYDAYFGAQALANPTERRRLLDFLPEAVVRDLARRLTVTVNGPFASVADAVAELAWGQDEQTASMLEFFGYPAEGLPVAERRLSAFETVVPFYPPLRPLHDYQASVLIRSLGLLTPPCARLLIQMPTGSGKTRTAMELIAEFLNRGAARTVLWLAHSEELCEQATAAFEDVWRHRGAAPISLVRCWGRYAPPLPPVGAAMIVAGFLKLNSLRRRATAPPEADLIVVDEAHMVLAPKYSALVHWAQTRSGRTVGLSATPGRSTSSDEENAALAAFFYGNFVGVETGGQGVIEFLQGRGILARVEREALHTGLTFHLTTEEWRSLEDELEYPATFLKRLAEDYARNRMVIERLWRLAAEGVRVLVFAASVEQSRLLCAALLHRGANAAHIDGETPTETRRAAVARFRNGAVRFLLNFGVLTTGFDAPATDVVFIARPTKSIVLYSQMVGRGLRGPAVGGTPVCRLIDVIDNIVDYSPDLDDVYEYFADYWEPRD
jgi:superfamily II DNA or RNA helicase